MLKVNLQNGKTETLDLFDANDRARWRQIVGGNGNAGIRALGIHDKGVMYALPFPIRFRKTIFDAEGILADGEPVAERVLCYADDIRVTLTVYKRTRMSRVDVDKIGRIAFAASNRQERR